MINNPTKLLFMFTLMGGTIISISANSWFGAWIGLEINLLSFIPLMTYTTNSMSSEASLKYFLTQALASATLLFSVIFAALIFSLPNTLLTLNPFLNSLIASSLLLKMGAAPFHFWFPGVMEGINWMNGFMLMTWQKIAPLMLLSYNLSLNTFSTLVIILSILIGSLGGLNQTSLRKILAYSSINHIGWLIAALVLQENIWNIYFVTYSFLTATIIIMLQLFSISHINQTFSLNSIEPIIKFSLFTSLLSLGGLPPFLGFLPKWIVIQNLASSGMMFTVTVMVTTTLITLFYYLRVSFSAFMLSYSETLWCNPIPKLSGPILWPITLTAVSTLGLPISSLIFHLF
uniref:NADH-ubiquinone oxidoreductase chain 2 n=1 Tax=Kamimuria chungnanshana TaxID=1720338 RepID=A0A0U2L7Z1_9NEOP|nr:NADH dehydrogenase subunit 2 [Kamimuria chungnanshana]ALF36413.1 NADH dehydrogenase subunit 2 [Kamimuria chungnanshana]